MKVSALPEYDLKLLKHVPSCIVLDSLSLEASSVNVGVGNTALK